MDRYSSQYKFLATRLLIRITGGLFWFLFGLLIIENQMTGKIDPATNPYVYYSVGILSILIGILQIFGRYELAKEAFWLVIYGKNYQAQNEWKKLLINASNEIDEKRKKEIIDRASLKLENAVKKGETTKDLSSQITEIKKKDENLDYQKFYKKYLKKSFED